MPKIPILNSHINPSFELQTAQAIGQSTGAGLSHLGEGLAKFGAGINEYEAKTQVTKLDPVISKNNIDFATKISNLNESFDSNDPEAVAKIKGDYDKANEEALNEASNPMAREYIQKKIDSHAPTLWNMVLAKNSSLQSQEVVAAVKEKGSVVGQTVSLTPELLSKEVEGLRNFVTNLPGDPPEGTKEKIYEEMVKKANIDAAEGGINQNPYKALADLKEGKKWATGDDTNRLIEKAQSHIRAIEANGRLNSRKSVNAMAQLQKQNFQDLYHAIDDGVVNYGQLQQALDREDISPAQHDNLRGRLDNMVDGTVKGDPTLLQDAFNKLRLPDGDPRKITDFETLTQQYNQGRGKGLGKMELRMLAGMYLKPEGESSTNSEAFNKLVDEAAAKIIKPSFVPWGDRPGLALWGKFLTQAHADYESKIKKGFTPEQLLTPGSKDYLGNSISAFQRSRAEMSKQSSYLMHDMIRELGIGDAPQQPVGSDPNQAPLPAKGSGLSGRDQAILESLKATLPKAPGSK